MSSLRAEAVILVSTPEAELDTLRGLRPRRPPQAATTSGSPRTEGTKDTSTDTSTCELLIDASAPNAESSDSRDFVGSKQNQTAIREELRRVLSSKTFSRA